MSKKTEALSGERTTIGKIAGAHGVNGVMILLPLTDYPDRFLDMKELALEQPGKPKLTLKVTAMQPYAGKGTFFLRAEGVNNRDEAEKLKNAVITIPNDERVNLSDDEYWIDDMVGLKAVDSVSGQELGTLVEILQTGSNDVYLIRTPDGATKPIPAMKESVLGVDIENGTITVAIPEGLWD